MSNPFSLQRYTVTVAFEARDAQEAHIAYEALTRAIHRHIDPGACVTMTRIDRAEKLKAAAMRVLVFALLTAIFYLSWRHIL